MKDKSKENFSEKEIKKNELDIEVQRQNLEKQISIYQEEIKDLKEKVTTYAIKIKELSLEKEDTKKNSQKRIVNIIINILSNIKIFSQQIKEEDTKKAMNILEQQQITSLKNMGIERKIVKEGDLFDPLIHNAISTELTKEKSKTNTILHSFSDVFFSDNKCIAVANVIVYKLQEEESKSS